MKNCTKCKKIKSYEFFHKDKNRKDGFHTHCKVCIKEYQANNKERLKEYSKEYEVNNKEKRKEYHKEYRLNNKEKIQNKAKEFYINNKEYYKEYATNNKERKKEYYKEYAIKNKERKKEYLKHYREKSKDKLKEYFKNYVKNKRKNDYLYKFNMNTRSLIKNTFKRGINNNWNKKTKTENILGCTIEEFRCYIEIKFTKKMTFENYGEWHLDHIIPISSAQTEEDIIRLNHYTNFQPLWAKDNLSKGNKIIHNTQLKLI
jgi:hypothetical protein